MGRRGRKAKVDMISKAEAGKRLRFYRKDMMHWTLEKASKEISRFDECGGITKSGLSQAERGKIYILEHYPAIVKAYGIRMEALMAEGEVDRKSLRFYSRIAKLQNQADKGNAIAQFVLENFMDEVERAIEKLNTDKD